MDELIAFVTARLDEDETVAGTELDLRADVHPYIRAARAIIERAEAANAVERGMGKTVLRYYAAIWSDHPDYRQEWAL